MTTLEALTKLEDVPCTAPNHPKRINVVIILHGLASQDTEHFGKVHLTKSWLACLFKNISFTSQGGFSLQLLPRLMLLLKVRGKISCKNKCPMSNLVVQEKTLAKS